MSVLHIENLRISFTQYERGMRKRTWDAVRNMNLDVSRGELAAVVGASGSGKSLLAHAVMGILPYNAKAEGEILYCGEELTKKRVEKLRGREIVLVPQSLSYLDPMMKIGPQIRRGRKEREIIERQREIFRQYHLSQEVEDLYPFELSGGMNRRVLVSTALMENPKLVIADEPTPGLDLVLAGRVMSHFRHLANQGAAVLVITHDLKLALQTADKIVVFYDGETVEETTPEAFQREETLQHPYTKALWRAMPEHGFHVPEEI